MNTQHELDSYLLSAVEWARAAGLAHLRYFRKGNLDIRTKLNDADIVTVADAEAEQAVIQAYALCILPTPFFPKSRVPPAPIRRSAG